MSLSQRKKTAVVNTIILLIVLAVGSMVVFSTTGSIEPYADNVPAAQTAENIMQSVEDASSTVFGISTIIPIIIIGVVIIILVMSMGSMGRAFAR